MSDLEKYIHQRKKHDPAFALGYDEGYKLFKFCVVNKPAHKRQAGLPFKRLPSRYPR